MKRSKLPTLAALVQIDRRALATALRAAIPFASTDETRPHLSSVAIGVRNGRLTVCATDGHRAALVQAKRDDAAIFAFYGGRDHARALAFGGQDPILLPAKKVAAALKGQGKEVEACFRPHEGPAGTLRIGVTLASGEWEDRATVQAVSGVVYPPIFQVCTGIDPKASRGAVAPSYLEAIGTLGRTLGAQGVEITISDPLAPQIFTGETDDFRFAVWQMPVRLDKGANAHTRDPRIAQIIDPGPVRAAAAAE